MATLLSSIETQARRHLNETTARFWSSAELIDIANKGIKDLWGATVELYEEHFLTIDATNVSLAADATSLTGVPTDVHKVYLIEPRDTTSAGTMRDVVFQPRDYNSHEFINARSLTAQDPSSGLKVFYAVTQAGAPVGAPTIYTAPKIRTSVDLRFVYVPTVAEKTATDSNPIPGESDQALITWVVAWAYAKEREDKSPDPNWIAAYATEKRNILSRLAPRQVQEPEIVSDVFGAYF